jgi:hypothetical protein
MPYRSSAGLPSAADAHGGQYPRRHVLGERTAPEAGHSPLSGAFPIVAVQKSREEIPGEHCKNLPCVNYFTLFRRLSGAADCRAGIEPLSPAMKAFHNGGKRAFPRIEWGMSGEIPSSYP